MPEEWLRVLGFLEKYPAMHFKARKISHELDMPPQKVSKILLYLHRNGYLERIERETKRHPLYRMKN